MRAASFDIQDPHNPILVGGAPSLPSGPEGEQQISDLLLYMTLQGKRLMAELGEGPELTAQEIELLESLSISELPFSMDSLRLQAVEELEEGVPLTSSGTREPAPAAAIVGNDAEWCDFRMASPGNWRGCRGRHQ